MLWSARGALIGVTGFRGGLGGDTVGDKGRGDRERDRRWEGERERGKRERVKERSKDISGIYASFKWKNVPRKKQGLRTLERNF